MVLRVRARREGQSGACAVDTQAAGFLGDEGGRIW
jgi:hypothetical protein